MTTTAMLHSPSTLANAEILSYPNQFVRRCSSSYAGGFRCWLPLTGCSIDFQKCQAPPSIVQETGPTGDEMARQSGVARVRALTGDGAKMAGGEGIRLRRSFPNLLQRSHP